MLGREVAASETTGFGPHRALEWSRALLTSVRSALHAPRGVWSMLRHAPSGQLPTTTGLFPWFARGTRALFGTLERGHCGAQSLGPSGSSSPRPMNVAVSGHDAVLLRKDRANANDGVFGRRTSVRADDALRGLPSSPSFGKSQCARRAGSFRVVHVATSGAPSGAAGWSRSVPSGMDPGTLLRE